MSKQSKNSGSGKSSTSKQSKITDCASPGNVAAQASAARLTTAETDDARKDSTLESVIEKLDDVCRSVERWRAEMRADIVAPRTDLGGVERRIQTAEARISDIEEELPELRELKALKAEVAQIREENAQLRSENATIKRKLIDLESRGRRKNLRLVGIPEGEESADVEGFFESLIQELVEVPQVTTEWAHRLGAIRGDADPPRGFIMRFLNFKDKERVMRAARLKKNIQYKGKKIYFAQDLPYPIRSSEQNSSGSARNSEEGN